MTDNEALTQTEHERLKHLLVQLEGLNGLKKYRRASNGLAYNEPNAWQLEAHKCPTRIRICCFGNRSGKSHFGAVELAMHCSKQYPDWYPMELRYERPVRCVAVVTSFPVVDKMLEPKIRELFPKGEYKIRRTSQRHISRIEWKDGSTIDVLTMEMDQMAFESADWDLYWGDEPQTQTKYQAILRGLTDRQGRVILSFTPLIEPWMKTELIDKEDGEQIKVFSGSTYENMETINGTPILSKQSIEWLEDQMPDDVKETRIYGKFFHLRGVVYKEYTPSVHEYTDDVFRYQYPDPVICVLDPHDRVPHHVIWAAVDKTDDIYIMREVMTHCTIQELSNLVRSVEKQYGYRVRKRVIDPNFGRKPVITTGRTVIQELAYCGCPGWYEADDAVEEGHMKVRWYLHFQKKLPLGLTNKPKLFFHKDNVPITIKSVKHLQFEEWSGKTKSEKDPKETEKELGTHGADTIRYLCMSNPRNKSLVYKSDKYELAESPY